MGNLDSMATALIRGLVLASQNNDGNEGEGPWFGLSCRRTV